MIEDRISTRQTSEGRSKAWKFLCKGVGVWGCRALRASSNEAEERRKEGAVFVRSKEGRYDDEEFGRLYIARTQIRSRHTTHPDRTSLKNQQERERRVFSRDTG